MAQNYNAHPLFHAKDEDSDPPEVLTIQVYRREGNAMVLIPRRFLAEEFTDETQLADWYGGGFYEIVARNASRITARKALQLPGPPKPLFDAESMPQTPAPSPQTGAVASPMAMSGTPPWWIPLVGALAPVVMTWMSNRQQSEQRAQEAHQALMTTMMSNSQNANMQMITLLTNLKGNAPNGAEFKEGMSFMENILSAQIEKMQKSGDESDDMKETMSQLMQAMQLAQMFGGNGTPVKTPESDNGPT